MRSFFRTSPSRLLRLAAGLALLISAAAVPLPGRPSPRRDGHTRPTLVIAIIVDQMRADYLDRFGDLFGKSGFALLTSHGAAFTNCAYPYAATNTAPGHSLFLSGVPPSRSGIIGNEWFDRGKGRVVYCVEDSSVESVGIDPADQAGRMSPGNFSGSSLGDWLIAASPESRVIGISIKDRGAILPAGRRPTGAFWFDPRSGNWISSTYYMPRLPDWAARYNSARRPEAFLGREWQKMLPDSCYRRAGADDVNGEGVVPGETRPVFPHEIRDNADPAFSRFSRGARRFDAVITSPFGNDLTAEFAETAVQAEHMGMRGVTDILAISFSSPDYCGHIFGPDSQEMEDMMLRLDRTLEEFLEFVFARVGKENVVVVLTADHGVCPLPERAPVVGAARINPGDVLADIRVHLGQHFDYNEGQANLVQALSNGYIYLDDAGIRGHGFSPAQFRGEIISSALREPNIVRCLGRDEIAAADPADDADTVRALLRGSFDDRRSGDIVLITSEWSFFASGTTGTTHGSTYWYDRHVPLLMFGQGIQPGRFSARCSPAEIGPTLARLIGIAAPQGQGATDLLIAGRKQR